MCFLKVCILVSIPEGVRVSKSLYDSIPEGYYHKAMVEGTNIQRFWHKNKYKEVLARVKLSGKESVLDLGCGPGTLLSLLPKRYRLAVGLDIAEKQINYARKKFNGIFWMVGRIEELKFKPESFDYVFIIEVLEHLPLEQVKSTLKSVKRIMKKNGGLIITTPNNHSLWPLIEWLWNKVSEIKYQEQHITKFNRKETTKLLDEIGFKVVDCRTIFVVSPFIALLSPKLAEKILELEKKVFKRLGAIQIIEALKV